MLSVATRWWSTVTHQSEDAHGVRSKVSGAPRFRAARSTPAPPGQQHQTPASGGSSALDSHVQRASAAGVRAALAEMHAAPEAEGVRPAAVLG